MTDQSFSTTFTVDQSPDDVFAAITNVRGWWSGEITGDTDRLGAEFSYRYEDIHRSTQKITELVPGKRVAWHVTDAYLSFVSDTREWVGTDIVFDIAAKDNQTELRFTHVGLVPEVECYDQCSPAWSSYIAGSLHELITTGQGRPNQREEATA
jgi:uncharacterized protein YndB with AHSA1/START domain